MGQSLIKDSFSADDYQQFAERLKNQLNVLPQLLARDDFDAEPASLGAELELSLIDAEGRPACCNLQLLNALEDDHFTPEIDRFNLEYNCDPLPLAGAPFSTMAKQLHAAINKLRANAGDHGIEAVMTGILPTLEAADLAVTAMTPTKRYQALDALLREHRERPFELNINGDDPLRMQADCVTVEGANTSFQVHLKVPPERFVGMMNASYLALGPVLAVTGNSPYFLGHRLWDETRIVVFKQAVDDRRRSEQTRHKAARVGIGSDWWSGSAAQSISRHLLAHDVLLPLLGDEDASAVLAAGGVPSMAELRVHNGTIWHWNRPVYDSAAGGHLRIEFRALPSGPSIADMVANAALMLGLSLAFEAQGLASANGMPFESAEYNLYRGAQSGLDAKLRWPGEPDRSLIAATDIVLRYLPEAELALQRAGVNADEAGRQLDIVRQRIESSITGARWQEACTQYFESKFGRREALSKMLLCYRDLSLDAAPVHLWPQSFS